MEETVQIVSDIIRELEKFNGFNRWYWSLDPSQQHEVQDAIGSKVKELIEDSVALSWANEGHCY